MAYFFQHHWGGPPCILPRVSGAGRGGKRMARPELSSHQDSGGAPGVLAPPHIGFVGYNM